LSRHQRILRRPKRRPANACGRRRAAAGASARMMASKRDEHGCREGRLKSPRQDASRGRRRPRRVPGPRRDGLPWRSSGGLWSGNHRSRHAGADGARAAASDAQQCRSGEMLARGPRTWSGWASEPVRRPSAGRRGARPSCRAGRGAVEPLSWGAASSGHLDRAASAHLRAGRAPAPEHGSRPDRWTSEGSLASQLPLPTRCRCPRSGR
jgi:hypothetical protein